MILETAILNIKEGMTIDFEKSFMKAQPIISSMKGYINHDLQKCIEIDNQYILLVSWENLVDHETGFRTSPEYQEWKELLHHFYEPFPVALHYNKIKL